MDGFYIPPEDDEDPVMMLWRMENDARSQRRTEPLTDTQGSEGDGARILDFRPGTS